MVDLLSELARVGYPVTSVDELRTSGTRYVAAVPILLAALDAETDVSEKEWLVRALSVPWAKPAAIEPMIREFRAIPIDCSPRDELTRWAIGNALWVLWDDAYFDEMVQLATDERYGTSRQMVVLGFAKSRRPEQATTVLLGLIDDARVEGHAISALGLLAQPAARAALVEASDHPQRWIRNAAKKGLTRLDRLQS